MARRFLGMHTGHGDNPPLATRGGAVRRPHMERA